MATRTIVAIGGGHIKKGETEKIDMEIIARTGSSNPRATFIPTASLDDTSYVKSFEKVYSKNGCSTDSLLLFKKQYPATEIEEKILGTDLVYIGGGNTLFLYNTLQSLGIDKILHRAWEQGTVMSGLSAGCIIWHERGLTDSIPRKYVDMGGLAWVPGFVTPHYLREPKRRRIFQSIVQEQHREGLAIDDNCAVVYEGTVIKEVLSLGDEYDARLLKVEEGRITLSLLEKIVIDHHHEPWLARLRERPRSLRRPQK
jgi:peptidase E